MEQLKRSKMSCEPTVYSGTTVKLFPFDTRGVFFNEEYPLPQARYAGYKPELIKKKKNEIEPPPFRLHHDCFEAAPSTVVPCYEKHRDSYAACLCRYGMR